MLVIFPKYSYYDAKTSIQKQLMNKFISETITEYSSNKPDIFVEDEMGMKVIEGLLDMCQQIVLQIILQLIQRNI